MTYQELDAAGRRTGTPTPYGGRSAAPPLALPRRGPAGRRTLGALFWLGLAAAVLPWWLDTPPGSLAGPADLLTAAGRITGLVAGYLLLVQVLLMSRLGVLERLLGGERISRLHRDLGATLLVAVLAHLALLVVGYAQVEGNSVLAEVGVLLTDYQDMVSAFVAAGIMVTVGVTGVRAIRRVLPYELWYHLHLTSYLALLLGYGHQFSNGAQLYEPGPVRTGWIAAYLALVAALLWGRLLRPLHFNLRHRLEVADVVAESTDTVSIYLTGRRLNQIDLLGGQYFRWRFLNAGGWWQSHPFSVSAAANGRWLRLTVKVVGSHTADLRDLEPGTRAWAEGPFGTFTAAHRTRERALLIAGGSGIAPLRAMLEELPAGAALIYRARQPADVLLHEELEWIARSRQTSVWYVIGSRDDPGPRQVMSPPGLRRLVPDLLRRDVYLCGPPGLVDHAVQVLRAAGVRRRNIHLANFEL
ncbi:ferric reductase-like transmembrane domain-containing protein [Micromonospora sp. PLK6-60]|uniref:ferredoxin reductase family protein n=1 Tax=Micromonospora sp. PLK6-60 TaxID=2873383 RepID=UPI001CA7A553|nr:ferredoxin reductase family protein [Micromonospora sp. PLK6-60]MBY8873890.1 ferric reductase-like transmembrane domain-containing protein [Micromonospora sp. PLK6-60]